MAQLSIADVKKQNHSIVLWSEGTQYWFVFAPIVKYLQEKGVDFTYLASAPDDKGLEVCDKACFIGLKRSSFRLLNTLKADFVAMTTPGLGDLSIKRSKNVKHYCHVVHAPTDFHTYRRVSFECFDSIFCSGDFQMETIRTLEKKRGTEEKALYPVGCTYFDVLLEKSKETKNQTDNNTIVLAPTWGVLSALRKADTIVPPLLKKGYTVIIRPHPQSLRSEKELVEALQERYAGEEKIIWDMDADGTASFSKSALMISDISGVIFDFAFVYKKPVLCLDAPLDLRQMEGADIPHQPWEVGFRPQLGALVTPENIEKVATIAGKLIGNTLPQSLVDGAMYDFGSAGAVAGQTMCDIVASLKENKEASDTKNTAKNSAKDSANGTKNGGKGAFDAEKSVQETATPLKKGA